MGVSEWIDAGRIVNTHGVRGEVKIEVWLDSPELLKRCGRVFVDGTEKKILSAREHRHFLIAELEGVKDVNDAMSLKGKPVTVARADVKLPTGHYFLQDILGARVVTEEGSEVGILEEILERPASNVYIVRASDGTEHLIPAVDVFVRAVDAEQGLVTVRLIDGM